MKDIDVKKVCDNLNEVMECELAGVVRYTHSSMMVSGPHRIPIVSFLKEQANESLLHAQQAGEILTGLDGHPTQNIAKIKETNRHSIKDILEESLEHEMHAVDLYKHSADVLGHAASSVAPLVNQLTEAVGSELQKRSEIENIISTL